VNDEGLNFGSEFDRSIVDSEMSRGRRARRISCSIAAGKTGFLHELSIRYCRRERAYEERVIYMLS
jgi:hypothetical protein